MALEIDRERAEPSPLQPLAQSLESSPHAIVCRGHRDGHHLADLFVGHLVLEAQGDGDPQLLGESSEDPLEEGPLVLVQFPVAHVVRTSVSVHHGSFGLPLASTSVAAQVHERCPRGHPAQDGARLLRVVELLPLLESLEKDLLRHVLRVIDVQEDPQRRAVHRGVVLSHEGLEGVAGSACIHGSVVVPALACRGYRCRLYVDLRQISGESCTPLLERTGGAIEAVSRRRSDPSPGNIRTRVQPGVVVNVW